MTAKAQNYSFRLAAVFAAEACARGDHDDLVVLAASCPPIQGEQGDDGERAVAAIDVLRHIVNDYEEEQA